MSDSPLRAVYPGTFDALTYGHVNIINRASRIFDELVVAVATNVEKAPMFTVEERIEALREEVGHLVNVRIDDFGGITVNYAIGIGARVIIRGLRVATDFEFEMQMAIMNGMMESRVETLFLSPTPQTFFVSSSLVKEILHQGGDISKFVPPITDRMLRKKYGLKSEKG